MKITYEPKQDMLYIDLSGKANASSTEVAPGVVLDFSEDGELVGIELEHAASKVDLTKVNVEQLLAIAKGEAA